MTRKVAILLGFLFLIAVVRAQSAPPLTAKGMWIWKLWTANGGSLNDVIFQLKSVGVTWIVIKMADSDSYYNKSGQSLYSWAATYGGMDSVVSAFHANDIKIMGYQYVYGIPHYGLGYSEAAVANMILSVKGIDGLLVDAEIQYDTLATRSATAQAYMDSIRAHNPGAFVALTSWARVAGHSTFPWVSFLTRSDVNMPQTYWAARPLTPSSELSKMSSDFSTYTQTWVNQGYPAAAKPILPLGQAETFGYSNDVVAGDVATFCLLSQSTYHYPGVSLWEYTQITHSYVWNEYAAAWPLTSVANGTPSPKTYALSQNFPNPFNPSTTIGYQIPVSAHVILTVYDQLGRTVATLVDEVQGAGKHAVQWDASNLPTGMYYSRIRMLSPADPAERFADVRKMLLVK